MSINNIILISINNIIIREIPLCTLNKTKIITSVRAVMITIISMTTRVSMTMRIEDIRRQHMDRKETIVITNICLIMMNRIINMIRIII